MEIDTMSIDLQVRDKSYRVYVQYHGGKSVLFVFDTAVEAWDFYSALKKVSSIL